MYRLNLALILALSAPLSVLATINTYAGNGTAGFAGDGGAATAAALNGPRGLATDSTGNLYIADLGNHRIRRIDKTTKVITTVAGTGTPGFSGDGGAATAAQLNAPVAVVIDNLGDLYIADRGNHRIRRVAAGTGLITTVAGTGTPGFSGDAGASSAAQLNSPSGMAFLPGTERKLFVADRDNHRIRQLNLTTGMITTVAGTGFAGPASAGGDASTSTLNGPEDISLYRTDPQEFLISDTGNNVVRRLYASVQGWFLGTETNLTLSGPRASLRVSNTVPALTVDSGNHRIVVPDGVLAGTGTAGFSGDGGPEAAAQFNTPSAIVLVGTTWYVSDTGNNRIRAFDPCELGAAVGGQTLNLLSIPTCVGPQVHTFAAAAGQRFMIRMEGNWDGTRQPLDVTVTDPAGAAVTLDIVSLGAGSLDSPRRTYLSGTAATAGTYRIANRVNVVFYLATADCTPSADTPVSLSKNAGTAVVTVLVAPGCPMTTAVDQGWARVQTSQANGSSLILTVAFDTNAGAARSANLSVGGRNASVLNQLIGTNPGCAHTVALGTFPSTIPPEGLSGTVTVTTANVVGCAWTASAAQWVTFGPTFTVPSLDLRVDVQPNVSGQTRTTVISIAGQSKTVTQAPLPATSERQRFIQLLYYGFLGRVPSNAEVQFHDNSGVARETLTANFYNSAEYAQTGRYINFVYRAVLGRDVNYSDWIFQRRAINTGAIPSPAQLLDNVAAAPEALAFLQNTTNSQFVTSLYQRLFYRTPAQAELDLQVAALTGGLSRLQMIRNFLGSAEARLGSPEFNVRMLYYPMLLRDPDEAGFLFQVNAVKGGLPFSALFTNFTNSAEISNLLNGN